MPLGAHGRGRRRPQNCFWRASTNPARSEAAPRGWPHTAPTCKMSHSGGPKCGTGAPLITKFLRRHNLRPPPAHHATSLWAVHQRSYHVRSRVSGSSVLSAPVFPPPCPMLTLAGSPVPSAPSRLRQSVPWRAPETCVNKHAATLLPLTLSFCFLRPPGQAALQQALHSAGAQSDPAERAFAARPWPCLTCTAGAQGPG